jgi:hypothetical protein
VRPIARASPETVRGKAVGVGVGVGVGVEVAVAVAVDVAVGVGVKVSVSDGRGRAVRVVEAVTTAIGSAEELRQPATTISRIRAIMSRCMKGYVNRTCPPQARINHNHFIFPNQSPSRQTTGPHHI